MLRILFIVKIVVERKDLDFSLTFDCCIYIYIHMYVHIVQNTCVIIIPRIGYEIIAQSS